MSRVSYGPVVDNDEVKVFRYSFSEAIPIFFNRLKSGFFLVCHHRCKISTSNKLFARRRPFTTKTRIHFVFTFIFKFDNPRVV